MHDKVVHFGSTDDAGVYEEHQNDQSISNNPNKNHKPYSDPKVMVRIQKVSARVKSIRDGEACCYFFLNKHRQTLNTSTWWGVLSPSIRSRVCSVCSNCSNCRYKSCGRGLLCANKFSIVWFGIKPAFREHAERCAVTTCNWSFHSAVAVQVCTAFAQTFSGLDRQLDCFMAF